VDAKYKQSVSSQNLQQMVTYCWMTGCRHAVLVLPAHLAGGARYDLHSPDEAVTVHVVGMRIDGKDLASWKAAGEQLVRDCQAFLPVQNR
jgi:hypothetical protein